MNSDERRLLEAWRKLPEDSRQLLAEFADFLRQRSGIVTAPAAQTPLDIPRPADESLIKAVRRLKATYPMLDADHGLLDEVSKQMTRHLIHGEPAPQVIDRLEFIFRQKYDSHRSAESPAS